MLHQLGCYWVLDQSHFLCMHLRRHCKEGSLTGSFSCSLASLHACMLSALTQAFDLGQTKQSTASSLQTASNAVQRGHRQCGAAKSSKVIHTMHALPMIRQGLAKRAYVWSVPHVVHSAQELAVASGVGWLTAGDFTVGAAQLEGVAGHPGGLWVLPTAATNTCGNSMSLLTVITNSHG